jgi:dTDP-L-rhamnose 4-epimerase
MTGGAGFIGCEVAARLVDQGDRVLAVDSLHPQVHAGGRRPDALPDAVELLVADVSDEATWPQVLERMRPEVVVHLAAETGTGQSFAESTRHATVNVVGTTRMLDALLAADAAPAHIVLPSSRAVYGEGAWQTADGEVFYPPPRTRAALEAGIWDPTGHGGETGTVLASSAGRTVPAPTSVYGATKLAQEHVLRAWVSGTGTALSTLRFQNVYGPGQSLTNSYTGIVALFARLAREGKVIDVYEDGDIVRDFVYVADVADAVVAAITKPPSGPRTLDIGSGAPTTVAEIAGLVAAKEGAPAPEVSGHWRVGDIRAACSDPDPAASELGFRARWSLSDGLDALLAWIPR